ncbi:addiction module protein [Geomonas sp. Red69]|uniref:Addiction module protein n=1 Tax=Geomonas diazotrophica TaxID=2843197 RepID=A0ABX8JM94_9BACT|nr:addiction module protein [Geomonas diazotrophica]QWV99096.1 addiction module protein [Geomonas nitrogeniifigens]QXE88265.1 addiction module protein [Geomonas nitrogeniifigens]
MATTTISKRQQLPPLERLQLVDHLLQSLDASLPFHVASLN